MFVRSASFRSTDTRHMLKVFEQISGMKKEATKREAERKEMADVIEQEKLIEVKGELLVVLPGNEEADEAGRHPYTLKGVFPRPAPEGKKTDGTLEIHTNGIRFRPDGPASKIGMSPQSLQNGVLSLQICSSATSSTYSSSLPRRSLSS